MFSSMANSVWWVILCLAWFLAANLKWAQESIEGLASYFHVLAWGIPAFLSIVVLVTSSIDGDLFTGICTIGNLKPSALFNFVFVPMFACIGESAAFHIRSTECRIFEIQISLITDKNEC